MYSYYENDNIKKLEPLQVFVFGSNLRGVHGAGAALAATKKFGASLGVGVGFTGHCWALPTKDHNINTLNLNIIGEFVKLFQKDAESYPDLDFMVTKVGCGLAGYSDSQIAVLFKDSPINCVFHSDWKKYLE